MSRQYNAHFSSTCTDWGRGVAAWLRDTPDTERLTDLADAALRACGAPTLSPLRPARSPQPRSPAPPWHRRRCHRRSTRRSVEPARRLHNVAHDAGTAARRVDPPVRRAAAHAQGRPRPAGADRGGQDRERSARRGAGDDRHLRLRRRAQPPAARADDRQRAPRPPPDGAVAPARTDGGHHRVQLPRRRVELERGTRASSAATR